LSERRVREDSLNKLLTFESELSTFESESELSGGILPSSPQEKSDLGGL
jgi:hypothetical protein